jgi:hypothetical protein
MTDTLESLRAERDALQEEVARLRAQQATHVCAAPVTPLYPHTVTAGCAAAPPVLTLNTTNAPPVPITVYNTTACAGAAAQPQSVWFNVGGECA